MSDLENSDDRIYKERMDEYLTNLTEEGHCDIDTLDEYNGCSLLHQAARASDFDLVKVLCVHYNANIDKKDGKEMMTPLHFASRYGKNETERKLPGVTKSDDNDGTNIVKYLLKRGAVFEKDKYKLTPLHHAAMRGNILNKLHYTEQLKQESIPLSLQ